MLASLSVLILASTQFQLNDVTRTETFELRKAPSRVDNPLKGLVPYQGNNPDLFPCSLEFNYVPVSAVMSGQNQFNWSTVEDLLNDVSSRGHQAIIRFYLEYPNQPTGVPQYLIDQGVKLTKWSSKEAESDPAQGMGTNITPDYADLRLRQCLQSFIYNLARKYDGDPRLGYLTMGLLGSWGEWHTYPRDDLFAPIQVQTEVMDTFQQSFRKTPIMMRYPRGAGERGYAATNNRPFGYHDDSFAWATLDTGKAEDNWFFMPAMKKANCLTKWMKVPIGGEIRPEIWGSCFDAKPERKETQDFEKCVRTTHVTWLMDSGMFDREKGNSKARVERAKEMVRLMGYDFHVSKVRIQQGAGNLIAAVTIENQGVAPFYADWPLKLALATSDGKFIDSTVGELNLSGILPGDKLDRYFAMNVAPLRGKTVSVLLGCPNPLSNGNAVGFANETQDQTVKGWLTLGKRTL